MSDCENFGKMGHRCGTELGWGCQDLCADCEAELPTMMLWVFLVAVVAWVCALVVWGVAA